VKSHLPHGDRKEGMRAVISGIHQSGTGKMIIPQVLSELGYLSLEQDGDIIVKLMEIFSIHGLHPSTLISDHKWLINLIKKMTEKDPSTVPLAIACLRRIRNERKFIWRLYMEHEESRSKQIAAIATAACVNGWGPDRVRIILESSPQVSILDAVKLIKAINHYPLMDMRDFNLIDKILHAAGTTIKDLLLIHPVVEFYCVNKDYKRVCDIVNSVSMNEMTEVIYCTIFRHVNRTGDGNLFFHFHDCMQLRHGIRKYLNQKHADSAIDFSLSSNSGKRLIDCLELIHLTPPSSNKEVKSIVLDGHRRSRIEALGESSDVPIRVRKKIRQFLKFI
jgi:hypothetical protein